MTKTQLWLLAACIGCGGAEVRFPLRAPYTQDTDVNPVSLPCRPDPSAKEPHRMACMPKEYVSPFVWILLENSIFGRISRGFALDVVDEARNSNSLDEVADSSWFTNRKPTSSPEDKAKGACKPEDFIDTSKPEKWLIDHGKDNGSTLGFRVVIPGQGKYLLKADEADKPERASAASVIGAAFYHNAGYFTSCEQVVYIRREQLELGKGLTIISNAGVATPLDEAALTSALARVPRRGDTFRMQASKWLDGAALGPFRYEKTRSDDPNDIIRHEDRRELRGGKLLAAWLNHWDAREQNSMDMWLASDKKNKESSPGYVRHYIIDTSDIFGETVKPDAFERRLGHSYTLDFTDMAIDLVTLGLIERPWDRARVVPGRELFGYYSGQNFDPETWKTAYPNPAFLRMTERDAAWMARIIARFSPDDVRAIVDGADFSDPSNGAYLTELLLERQRIILKRYLTRLSPIGDVRTEPDGRVCGQDFARLRGVFSFDQFRYRIEQQAGNQRIQLTPELRDDGVICFLPKSVAPETLPEGDAGRVVIFHVDNGTGAGLLDIHAYDLGPTRGMRVVGLIRTEN